MKSLSVFAAIILFPVISYSSPIINSTDKSTLVHNGLITVSGQTFGVKSPAAPYFYDNFDGGSSGVSIIGKPGTVGTSVWKRYGNVDVKYSNTTPYGGRGLGVYKQSPGDDFNTGAIDGLRSKKIFFSVNYKWAASGTNWGDYSTVYKPLRVTGSSGLYTNYPAVKTQCQPIGNYCYDAYGSTNIADSFPYLAQSQWHRSDIYSTISDVGVGNGVVKTWHDLLQNMNLTNAVTRRTSTEDDNYDSALIPMEIANNSEQTYTFYADNFYLDNTLARVELCDSSLWSTKKTCDLQIPTKWDASSLTFMANQGAFVAGKTAYLYVVDADGNVSNNCNGYPITIGDGAALPAPAPATIVAPTGLRVIGQ